MRQKEEERKRQAEEAFEREQKELEKLQKPDARAAQQVKSYIKGV